VRHQPSAPMIDLGSKLRAEPGARLSLPSDGFHTSTMRKLSIAMLPRDPNPAIFVWFDRVETGCLALLILISSVQVVAWLAPGPGWATLSSWLPMKPESAAAALLSTFCLMFLGTGHTRWRRWISPLLAAAVILLASHAISGNLVYPHGISIQTMTLQSASAFLVLGLTMFAMTVEKRMAVWLSDLLTLGLCILTFTLVSGYLFGRSSLFGLQADVPTSSGTLLCLLLLTLFTVLRRAENGIFSIYAGSGNGGNLARILSPILLVAPFFREGTRARLIGVGSMPPHYTTALLASSAAVFSISLLLYLVWKINEMESKIHDLALRDELTGLHNLRGFRLLADHAMRMAQRAKVPFSVMFIDLDDLKKINDSLGHDAGSAYISEAAEILRSTFRETDALGRIGGDEFAVAGQFSRKSMSAAALRLNESCADRNSDAGRQYALSLSVGYATSDEKSKGTLDMLMARADESMYEAKRSKKEQHSSKRDRLLDGDIVPR
jgi:diguanylate cyclase (GGDEF)-like protein